MPKPTIQNCKNQYGTSILYSTECVSRAQWWDWLWTFPSVIVQLYRIIEITENSRTVEQKKRVAAEAELKLVKKKMLDAGLT